METHTQAREADKGSSRCPYCHDILAAEEAARCQACSTPQHAECFREHRACVTLGCDHRVLDWKGLEVRVPRAAIRVRGRRDWGSTYWGIMIPAMVVSFFLGIASAILEHYTSWWRLNWLILPIIVSIIGLFMVSVIVVGLRSYFAMLSAPPRSETADERAQRHDWQSAVGMGVNSPRIVSEDAPVEDWAEEGADDTREARPEPQREAEGTRD